MKDAVSPAEIDPVDRIAILAAALPGAVLRQRRIAAPFETVWHVIADLENSTPRYEPAVAQLRVIERHGELLRLMVRGNGGRQEMMDAKLRPGWCLMQSDRIIVAFAARQVGSQTLLAHLEQQRVQTSQAGHASQNESRYHRTAEAKIDRELETIERLATQS